MVGLAKEPKVSGGKRLGLMGEPLPPAYSKKYNEVRQVTI
jgi:hypothetical protein